MRSRLRNQKLQEEWAVPLKSVEDIYQVASSACILLLLRLTITNSSSHGVPNAPEIHEVLPWETEN